MQLLIVDVQNTYRPYISRNLLVSIPEYSKSFSQVFYLWDNISGQDFYEEIPEEWMENVDFYGNLNSFTKNYAFFRGLMDKGIEDDEIIRLGKFFLENNINDGRDMEEDEDIKAKFNVKFKSSDVSGLSFHDYSFYLPSDLIDEINSRVKSGVVLVGGGRTECLKEVSLLLSILDISHTTNNEYTY